jgi:hypothetical protein
MGLIVFSSIQFDEGMIQRNNNMRGPELGKLEDCCATDELRKLANFDLSHEGLKVDVLDSRWVDLGHEALQVLVFAFEFKLGESGKDDPNWGIWKPSPLSVGDRNLMERVSSHVNPASAPTIASGEMWLGPVARIGLRWRETSRRADERSFGNPGSAISLRKRCCRDWADPPKNHREVRIYQYTHPPPSQGSVQ